MLNYQRVSGCLTSFSQTWHPQDGRRHLPKSTTDPQAKEGTSRHAGTLHMVETILFLGLHPVRHGANMAWKTEGFHAKNGEMTMKHVDFEWLLFENAGGGAGRGCAKYSYVDLDKSIFGLQIFRQLWCRQQHTYLQHETSLKPPRAIYIPIIIACPSFFGLVQFPWFVKAHLKLLTSNIWTQDSGRPLAPLRQR